MSPPMSDHHAAPTGDLRPEALRALADEMTVRPSVCSRVFDDEELRPVRETLRAIASRDEALASAQPAAVAGDDRREEVGWLYYSPDSGTEWSDQHPVSSGEVPDALEIRPATAQNLRDELIRAWADLTEMSADQSAAQEAIEDLQADYEELKVWVDNNDVRAIAAAIDGIADDYMTSEHHHPGYVLIPSAKFEQLRAALQPAEKAILALFAAPEAAALERAAQVAEKIADANFDFVDEATDFPSIAQHIANSIRALNSATPARLYTEADMAAARAEERERAVSEACKPWDFSVGEPPEWGSPLHGVFVAGMAYSERLLAGLLDVKHYEGGDGSEDFDQDASKTLLNILTEAKLYDPEDGRFAALPPAADDIASGREGGR